MKTLLSSVQNLLAEHKGDQLIHDIHQLPGKKRQTEIASILSEKKPEQKEQILQEIKGTTYQDLLSALKKNQETMANYHQRLQKESYKTAADLYKALSEYAQKVYEQYNTQLDRKLEKILLHYPASEERFPVIEKAMTYQESLLFPKELQPKLMESQPEKADLPKVQISIESMFDSLLESNLPDDAKKREIENYFKKMKGFQKMSWLAFYKDLGLEPEKAKKVKECNLELVKLLLIKKKIEVIKQHPEAELLAQIEQELRKYLHTTDTLEKEEKSDASFNPTETPKLPLPKVVGHINLPDDKRSRFKRNSEENPESNPQQELFQKPTHNPVEELVGEKMSQGMFLSKAGLTYDEINQIFHEKEAIPARYFMSTENAHFFTIGKEEQGGGNTAFINVRIYNNGESFEENTIYPLKISSVERNTKAGKNVQTFYIKGFLAKEMLEDEKQESSQNPAEYKNKSLGANIDPKVLKKLQGEE